VKNTKNFLAIDFGASNGRAIVGQFDGNTIVLNEVHRFENRPVFAGGVLFWDFLRLFSELKIGISNALKKFSSIESLGLETWGCDFGLLDKDKNLLSNPVHYRDKRTLGLADRVRKKIHDKELYRKTQAQILEINTIYQLYSLKLSDSPLLKNARYFLLLGDLFNFFLTGNTICEYSNATLTQLLNQSRKKWEYSIITILGLPREIFLDVTEPGTIIGKLQKDICVEINCDEITVSLPCYDTTSEITAIPVSSTNKLKSWAYLNCGTWAMVGLISDYPIVTDEGFKQGFGNEGGFGGKYHYLKNIIGLWIIQQCRKKWLEESGKDISWNEIMNLTGASEDINTFINIDDQIFEREVFDMPSSIINYCGDTGQYVPANIGEISRVFYESLVLKYALNVKKLEKITGRKIELLHLVGGGSKDELICQWTSNATGLPVIAGPAETTTTGNLLAQMIAVGDIKNIDEGREVVINSVKLNEYEPHDLEFWKNKFEIYKKVLSLEI
jgi:sugar (pentulose or hexulose) kinase